MTWSIPRKAKTRSRSPAMYSAGTVTCTPDTGAKSSLFRSMLRYQFSPPRKSRPRKFAYVEIHVRFGEPMRQRCRIRQAREKATSARHHIDFAAVSCTVVPAVP
jgi:hypothetical protein